MKFLKDVSVVVFYVALFAVMTWGSKLVLVALAA